MSNKRIIALRYTLNSNNQGWKHIQSWWMLQQGIHNVRTKVAIQLSVGVETAVVGAAMVIQFLLAGGCRRLKRKTSLKCVWCCCTVAVLAQCLKINIESFLSVFNFYPLIDLFLHLKKLFRTLKLCLVYKLLSKKSQLKSFTKIQKSAKKVWQRAKINFARFDRNVVK